MNRFYITTSIPYANAAPHLGHILDPLIADVLARYHRINGNDVRFLVGTDEHGAKIVRTAENFGKTPKQLVNENSEKYKEMHKLLSISWDDFIRTSDQKLHWPGAQKMWRALKGSGDIYWKKYRGLYCVGHEAFITEKELVDRKCRDHQKEPEIIEEENWFFRLSKYADRIEKAIASDELRVTPESRKNEILSFIRSGLEDVSISRPQKDISWGVPVPDDSTQTMYVWLEALTSYISSIGYGHGDSTLNELFKKWWPADVQVIGKDNLRFHAAIWPGMLFSAGLLLPKRIFVHGFVNVEGQKISKTVGNVISPDMVVKKYSADPVRYYFLREFPSHEDGDFSYKKFEDRYNGDLANGLGNLTARVTTLGDKISPLKINFKKDLEMEVSKVIDNTFDKYRRNMEEIKLNEALADIWELISFSDKYINREKPWEIKDQEKIRQVLVNSCYLVGVIANMLGPFLPETSEKIKKQIRFTGPEIIVARGENLFNRLG